MAAKDKAGARTVEASQVVRQFAWNIAGTPWRERRDSSMRSATNG
jgi:hypothetical protein